MDQTLRSLVCQPLDQSDRRRARDRWAVTTNNARFDREAVPHKFPPCRSVVAAVAIVFHERESEASARSVSYALFPGKRGSVTAAAEESSDHGNRDGVLGPSITATSALLPFANFWIGQGTVPSNHNGRGRAGRAERQQLQPEDCVPK